MLYSFVVIQYNYTLNLVFYWMAICYRCWWFG